MTPEEQVARWAVMPPEIWLAGADRSSARYDTVIRWEQDRAYMAPLPCGVRWHALRMPEELGLAVLRALLATAAAQALGPVLHDRTEGLTVWLLPVEPDTGAEWERLDPVLVLLTAGHTLQAPGPEVLGGEPVRWAHWPQIPGTLTPPDLLARALGQHLALAGPLQDGSS
ncbi:hypothetical protein C7C46_09050 [Streptomyces tateyamensis]|uniref:Uncharacterized protein n=1 Tax=Streptomyces tateyamensis TaxID=565073 RepID=A0A2V4NE89_9ACTN|nr:hypothetical protein [Streptomyces tateyamensis]PYC83469.1 hypothetical protein C7C46_09050 [Streptomyces tateyamensis]